MFLMGDAAACAKDHQQVPQGYDNLQLMLSRIVANGGYVGVCGTCMDARGIAETELFEVARRGTLAELTSVDAVSGQGDRVLTGRRRSRRACRLERGHSSSPTARFPQRRSTPARGLRIAR